MSSSQLSIKRWLDQVVIPYRFRLQVISQIDATLSNYSTLSPKTDSFTFDDGRTALLICLSGTILVNYRGSNYNIPIAIWLPYDFPKEIPIVYVTPTSDMIIKTSDFIDPAGKCINGYLDSWKSKPEACSLNILLGCLQDLFSRQPPLYAKPKQSLPTYNSHLNPPPSISSQLPPRPPLPHQLSHSISNPSISIQPHQKPLPPPRPPLPPPIYSQTSSNSNQISPPSTYPSSSQPFPLNHSIHPSHSSSPPSQIHPNNFLPQEQFNPTLNHSQHPQSSFNLAQPGILKPLNIPIEKQLDSLRIHDQASTFKTQNLLDDLDDHLNESTITTTTTTTLTSAPPIPPNPILLSLRQSVHQKLSFELDQLNTKLSLERDQLLILQSDLLKGEPAVLDEMARLEAVKDVCDSVGKRYESLIDQLNLRIKELRESRKIVSVDELICSTTVLHNQLWELIIEDQVIDDLIYHLARSLNNSSSENTKIDLEKFLKKVRGLGYEQFLIRSMINQISKGLGLTLSNASFILAKKHTGKARGKEGTAAIG
ncbi:hypothetical protein O181_040940 [Austropuccinia psidii MF-1]|uniref:UEV domain-containing protein n=1 Tax=Austropuccinia psidii MF-1 TaxID=1389203 RepID=A0A9Q3DE21_9BASI|nr:hypothetical protein [Austropuccinia psidii MF-1]